MIENKTIVVWFSCGAASAVAAKKTIELYGENNNIIIANTPIKEEHEDNRRFLHDVEKWIGQEIISVVHPLYPESSCEVIWKKRKYMSGVSGAPCTMILKKQARQEWEKVNHVDYYVLGFTYDERKRHDRFVLTERDNVIPVLIDLELTKDDCFHIIHDAGIELPNIYKVGFPNANCIGCVKSASPTYWNLVRREFPEVFNERATTSREIGAKLVIVKGERVFLDQLDPSAMGRKLKEIPSWDCGIFCEETENIV